MCVCVCACVRVCVCVYVCVCVGLRVLWKKEGLTNYTKEMLVIFKMIKKFKF